MEQSAEATSGVDARIAELTACVERAVERAKDNDMRKVRARVLETLSETVADASDPQRRRAELLKALYFEIARLAVLPSKEIDAHARTERASVVAPLWFALARLLEMCEERIVSDWEAAERSVERRSIANRERAGRA